MSFRRRNTFRDGKVQVMGKMCTTCIFRPGNLMSLEDGTVERMVNRCLESDDTIPCHSTLGSDGAICRGLFDRHGRDIMPIRLAVAMQVLEEVEEPKSE